MVVAGPDNAATELIAEGQNGVVARSADPAALAEAIESVYEQGTPLRGRTAAWFGENAARLSLERSLAIVSATYADSRSTTSR